MRQAHAKHTFHLAIQGSRQVRRGQSGILPEGCWASLLWSSTRSGLLLSEETAQEVGPLGFLAFGRLSAAGCHTNVEITKDLGALCFRRFPVSVFGRFRFQFSGGQVSGSGFPAAGFPAAVFRRPGFRQRFSGGRVSGIFRWFPEVSGAVFRRPGFRRRSSGGRVSGGGYPAAGFPAAVFRRPGFRLRFSVHGFPVFVSGFGFGRFRLPISGVLRPVSAQPAAGTNSTPGSPAHRVP